MTTKRIQQPMYLDADRLALLNQLSAETRIPKAAFIREAIEDLLIKHKRLKPQRRR
jgi:predicted DNA-binding protein